MEMHGVHEFRHMSYLKVLGLDRNFISNPVTEKTYILPVRDFPDGPVLNSVLLSDPSAFDRCFDGRETEEGESVFLRGFKQPYCATRFF